MLAADGAARALPALLLSGALLVGCKTEAPPTEVRVAAASDLTIAFGELGRLFERRTGQKVTFSFAASGTLAKQLGQGAPFDLFAAANATFVDSAVEAGACDGSSKALYARGHVVVWSKRGGATLTALSELSRADLRHIAIANPEHAPYGKAAREALVAAGVWRSVERKIVHAENVRHALQFAQTGNADVAIVARSLVVHDRSGQMLAVDPALHGPIEQTLVVCKRGKNEAGGRELAKLVASAEGQALLKRHGFGGSAEQAAQ